VKARALTAMASASVLALVALLAAAGTAQAAPPLGWQPEEGSGVEYDLADVSWAHQGHFDGRLGNWHTGYLNVEEDDDGVTGDLYDWRCPPGVQPPAAWDSDQTSVCKQKGYRYVENVQ
jgi:hypothetical protein